MRDDYAPTTVEKLIEAYLHKGYGVRTSSPNGQDFTVVEIFVRPVKFKIGPLKFFRDEEELVGKLTVDSTQGRERWKLASRSRETDRLLNLIMPYVSKFKAQLECTNDMG